MSAKQRYDEWRAGRVKKVGLKTRLKAEAEVERQKEQPFVTVVDHEDRQVKQYKRHIADIYKKRGRVTSPMIVSMPSEAYAENYDSIDWSVE